MYNLYSQAYALRCEKLLSDLCTHIIQNLLAVENVAHFLQESIEFEIPTLMESTLQLVIANFKDIALKTPDFIFSLPVGQFVSLLNSNDLNIDNESELVGFVRQFIAHHLEMGEKVPALPEEVAGPEVWSKLSPAE